MSPKSTAPLFIDHILGKGGKAKRHGLTNTYMIDGSAVLNHCRHTLLKEIDSYLWGGGIEVDKSPLVQAHH